MTEQITTKPFASRQQWRFAFSTGQPWAKRWARETGPYRRLPYKKRKQALFEMATATKAQDYERAGALAERLALKGESLAPGVTRIRGDLCNVHGKYGSCSAAGFGGPAKPAAAPRKRPGQRPKRATGRKRAAARPKKTEA